MCGFKDIGSKGHFLAEGVFWVKNPLGANDIFLKKLSPKKKYEKRRKTERASETTGMLVRGEGPGKICK